MTLGFWEKLPKPFFGLAPMADVTDAAFRRIIATYGHPDIFWTEFTSANGLMSVGRDKLLINFLYTEAERPVVAQIFSATPKKIEGAARLIAELGFDGIDINMGCPDKTVERQGAGAALIKNPKLVREIMQAAKSGAPDLPLSIKTRLGYNSDVLEDWLPELLAEEPAAITIHARTRKEMSKVPARWERIQKAVEIRDERGSQTRILGNGDLFSLADAKEKVKASKADGAMLGRAIFGNPWLFSEYVPSKDERLKVLVEHSTLFEELLGHQKSFAIMKKHFKSYLHGFDGAKELRLSLMETKNSREVETLVSDYIHS
jgi:nifR3 family TIM-barrel protein